MHCLAQGCYWSACKIFVLCGFSWCDCPCVLHSLPPELSVTDGAVWNWPAVRGLEPVGIMALRSIVAPWSDQLCHLTLHHNMIPSAGCTKGYLGELFTHCSPDLISYPVMKFSRKRDSETQGSIKTFLGNSDWQPLVDHNFNWLV